MVLMTATTSLHKVFGAPEHQSSVEACIANVEPSGNGKVDVSSTLDQDKQCVDLKDDYNA